MNGVIYARYSSDSQCEESIEGRLCECREYAERNGMTVVGTYIDRALSAKMADRPEFHHMIKDSVKEMFEIGLSGSSTAFRVTVTTSHTISIF